MTTDDMAKLKEGLLYGILEAEETIDLDICQNITDTKGSCLIIKSLSLTSINAIQTIINRIPGYNCLGPDEENLGLLVKELAPEQIKNIMSKQIPDPARTGQRIIS